MVFVMGLQSRYREQQWFKKVFYKKDGVLAAVFTERQQHLMSSYSLRKQLFFGDWFSAPFSKLGHNLFFLSVLQAYLSTLLTPSDGYLGLVFQLDRLCVGLIALESLVWFVFKIPILYLAFNPRWMDLLHRIKQFEAQIHQQYFKSPVKQIPVERQPYI
mmetsp:Transcript_8904/g.15101  ORF Transcript_8904/g.15101 Transcript_8904/m.15101 type:complete len:159 (-) Transcript_8904:144-620(-)